MSVSLMTMEPFSGFSRPTSDFRNTDLPVPDGPSSTEISPGGRVSVTSLQMFWLPNDLVSPSTSTATPTPPPPPFRPRCRAPPPPHQRPPRPPPPRPGSFPGPRPAASASPGIFLCLDVPRISNPQLLISNEGGGVRLRASRSTCDPDVHRPHGGRAGSPGRWNAAGAALPKEGGPW